MLIIIFFSSSTNFVNLDDDKTNRTETFENTLQQKQPNKRQSAVGGCTKKKIKLTLVEEEKSIFKTKFKT